MISTSAVVYAAVAGVFGVLAVRQLLPSRPSLGHVRSHLPTAGGEMSTGLPERLGGRLLDHFSGALRISRRDLALLEISPAAHTGRQACYALAGLIIPQLLAVLLALTGSMPPVAFPALVSFGFAASAWVAVDMETRKKARLRREEFRYATASFLERAALTRAADAGAADALYRTAAVGDGWALTRIRQVLERSRLSGESPWDVLAQLAEEIGVAELARPAQTFTLAGEEGATVYATLKAQAQALRTAIVTDAKAEANQISTKLIIPVTGLAFVFLVFIGYPALARMLSA